LADVVAVWGWVAEVEEALADVVAVWGRVAEVEEALADVVAVWGWVENLEVIQNMVEEDTGVVTGPARGTIIIITTIQDIITIRVILHLFMAITIRT
jgi:hypothetical protein